MQAQRRKRQWGVIVVMLIALGFVTWGTVRVANAQGGLASLKTVQVPLPPNLNQFVRDTNAAIQLGKALFWDQQVGGDGIQACASCHFQAGSDVRAFNTVNPGRNGVFNTVPPGHKLTPDLFPFTNDDIAGAQGIRKSNFLGLGQGAVDECESVPDPVFFFDFNRRQVTGRKAPSAVNAIFYFRNFWDGRANNAFNGANPNGPSLFEPQMLQVIDGVATPVFVSIPNASLASQATGPPNNPVEMSCNGRTFPELGRKLLGLRPLGLQTVHPRDSVLGELSRAPQALGLNTTYGAMIRAAFLPRWWRSDQIINGFTVMENNFSLFFGLCVMLYESTLVSDNTPFDQFMEGNTAALNATQQAGLDIFTGKGRCDKCHGGAELTDAAVGRAGNDPLSGFFNVGVRPLAEDGGDILQPGSGMFKTPMPRNAELNGPYFHNGGKATLRQVVDFYDRGGDFPNRFTDSQIRPLSLTNAESDALVAFLVALTDERVRFERAPFDHPSLKVPNIPLLEAVGARGRTSPVRTFLGLSPFQP